MCGGWVSGFKRKRKDTRRSIKKEKACEKSVPDVYVCVGGGVSGFRRQGFRVQGLGFRDVMSMHKKERTLQEKISTLHEKECRYRLFFMKK